MTAPDGLLDAFAAYEKALLTNDVTVLDTLFAPGPDTVRGDGTTLLVGHGAIAGFRSSRASIPTRQVSRVLVREVTRDAALIMASTEEPSTGATGLQTQLWQRVDGNWKVTAAHVTLPRTTVAPAMPSSDAVDATIWRVVGTPLVAPTGSGDLDGATVAVKDLFAVAGERIGAGNPTWLTEQTPQTTTAPAVSALLAAGARITGLAHTDEFAFSLAGQNPHYGTSPNPAAPNSIGGGSTSGPAAAVALGQVTVGLGTDTAGSIRVPASYQGLVGIRTTHGAIPADGVLPLAPSFDTVGWLSRDVATARSVARVLLPDTSSVRPARTLILPTVEAHASDAVRAVCADQRSALVRAGVLPPAEVVDLEPDTLESWFSAFRTVQGYEAWRAHGTWLTAHPSALGPAARERFSAAAAVTATEAAAARRVAARARAWLLDLLIDAVLVLPSSAGAAPARDASAADVAAERAGTLRLTCLAGLAGAPAVSVPGLRVPDGRPAGLCLVGTPGSDHRLLYVAAAIEETL
ncbi:AtzH-like domain-containing protein [Nocardia neocaledoniensis]|uniref:AtzH-like domain-containing protein n=1 Tax=Nocardia neocaledoniensis TaxID=236511 RepID=UPI002457D8F5|nr:AtzH-like domain-containing protein [Nocardia neocaledoniensis]